MQVKVKVSAKQPVQLPGRCVHCYQPASEWLAIEKRNGRLTRMVDMPLCANCARISRQRSGEEERLVRLGLFLGGFAFFITLAATVFLTPAMLGIGLRALFGLAAALLVAGLLFMGCKQASRRAISPEKKAVLDAAQIRDFSWRTTTFAFQNDAFAAQFKELNQSLLMEDISQT